MVRRIRLQLPRIRHFPIFRIALICQSQRMQTMCISAKTTQYTERNTKSFQTPRVRSWYLMYLPAFLSEPVDVSKYGIIYGGVQKNVRPAWCCDRDHPRGSDL